MMQSRILFSFDDARLDTYNAVKVAGKYGIKSTVNVTTAYVDKLIDDSNRPSVLPAMSREQVIELSKDCYVELAGHSHNHKNDFDDILKGKKYLQEWIGEEQSIGFASPNSKLSFRENTLSQFKANGFDYVRIGPKIGRRNSIYRVLRKISRLFGVRSLLYCTYIETLKSTVEDKYVVHGVPVLNDNTVGQFKYIVDKCIKNGYDCIFIFHSVLNDEEYMSDDTWTWSMKKYVEFCEYLQEREREGQIIFSSTKELVNCQ